MPTAPAAAATRPVPAGGSPRRWPRWLALLLPLLLALVAYADFRGCGLYFDDEPSLLHNDEILSGDWWAAAFGAEQALGQNHTPISHRPLTCLSLVLDDALFGTATDPHPTWAHRAINLLLHLVATALVVALTRRALRAPNLAARFPDDRALAVAFAAGCLFAVHPLGTDAVAYVTQRSVLLMATLGLAALYAALRAEAAPARATPWRAGAVACLCLAMASKEESVGLVVLLPLLLRAVALPSWRDVRARLPFLLAAASSWLVLRYCVLKGPRNHTVGYDTVPPATALEWLYTQAGVVVHYLRLCVWPTALRGCYDWPIVRSVGPALLPGALIVALVALTVVALRRWPHWGFLGAWFFVLLAPTSTILPIVTELAAERRVYLPMLAIVVPSAIGIEALWRRWRWPGAALLTAIVVAATLATQARVRAYRNMASFWTDAFAWHDPANKTYTAAIMLDCYGRLLHDRNDLEGARAVFGEAAACERAPFEARLHHASTLLELGDEATAKPLLLALGKDAPGLLERMNAVLDEKLTAVRRPGAFDAPTTTRILTDAELLARCIVLMVPGKPEPYRRLVEARRALGRPDAALAAARAAVDVAPDSRQLRMQLADLLLEAGREHEVLAMWLEFLARKPTDVDVRVQLGSTYCERGRLDLAQAMYEDAQRLQPDNAAARDGLLRIAARRGGR